MNMKIKLTYLSLIPAMALPFAAFAHGDINDVPGVDDGPALSSYQAKVMNLGFADLNGVSGANADGDAVTLAVEGPDGKIVKLKIDPISGHEK